MPDDIALVKRLKRNLLPTTGSLTNTALVRLALRNLAETRGVKARSPRATGIQTAPAPVL